MPSSTRRGGDDLVGQREEIGVELLFPGDQAKPCHKGPFSDCPPAEGESGLPAVALRRRTNPRILPESWPPTPCRYTAVMTFASVPQEDGESPEAFGYSVPTMRRPVSDRERLGQLLFYGAVILIGYLVFLVVRAVPGAAGLGGRAGGQRPAAVSRAGHAHRPLACGRRVRADRAAAAGAAGVAAGRRAGPGRRAGRVGAAGRGVGDAARADGGLLGMGADARALPGARAAVGNRRRAAAAAGLAAGQRVGPTAGRPGGPAARPGAGAVRPVLLPARRAGDRRRAARASCPFTISSATASSSRSRTSCLRASSPDWRWPPCRASWAGWASGSSACAPRPCGAR